VVALAAQVNEAGVAYVTLPSGALGQANPTTSAANGGYSFNVPNGIYRLDVLANGYQPYRTGDIEVTNGQLAQNIALSPRVNDATTQRILITASGFSPAQVTVAPGSVVEFVNLDLADHTTTSAQWESGVLAAGDSYKVKLSSNGIFPYSDGADATSTGTITVGNPPVGGANNIYLPVVSK
jgi:plastocyanin